MTHGIRIGELARRSGLTPDVLRVWERLFGLFNPECTPGGYRLYTPDDERLAHEVVALKARGLPLAVAVEQARAGIERTRQAMAEAGGPLPDTLTAEIDEAVRVMDQAAATTAVARAIEVLGPESAMVDVLLPYLVRLGRQWETGEVTVAHEHFASHIIRRHIGAQGAELNPTGRRTAIVACPPGERHDIGALMAAVALSRKGWSVRFLGADTPVAAIDSIASTLRTDVVVLGGTRRTVFEAVVPLVQRLRSVTQVAIGGAGANAEVAKALGAILLPEDPVRAVALLDGVVEDTSATA